VSFISDLAAQHDIQVVFQSFEGSEAFVVERTIYLDPDLYPPRMNWKFCHELAHVLLCHTGESLHTPEQEREADELAGELMLPEAGFRAPARREGLDALKGMFPHASWEVLARRRIRFRPAVLTIFDAEKLTTRQAPEGFAFPPRLTEPEREIVRRCYAGKDHLHSEAGGMMLEAYFVDEGLGVERVILLSEVEE